MGDTLILMGRPKKPPSNVVRIRERVLRKARMVSGAMGETLPDWISRVVEAAADAEIPRLFKEMGSPDASKAKRQRDD